MFKIHKQELNWGGRPLTFETGKIARQAHGSVLVTYGETTVLATVVAEKKANPEHDFFPLTVHYLERTYAAGRIPGGYFKREGKPTEKEVLSSRLIDRPIRPLFPHTFKNEVQVICKVLSHDFENDPDVVAMIAASAALSISGLPFLGPLAAARVGYKDGEFILNPKMADKTALDLIVAGTKEGVLMVESEAHELSEDVMLDAVVFGHDAYEPVIDAISALATDVNTEKWVLPEKDVREEKLLQDIEKLVKSDLEAAYQEPKKALRSAQISSLKEKVYEALVNEETSAHFVSTLFKKVESDVMRQKTLSGQRIDGRDYYTVRPIECEVGLFPRAHGSSLFTRGETQAMVFATLGTGQDAVSIDALEGERRETFMLHYNFPSYSVGEVRRLAPPGRREIGHGKLAWRALNPVFPTKEAFPYTVRVVSEITESNGSSSMATVCGTSLALMDAGVPLPRPVAGIAMGLIKENDHCVVLSDILGDEDHLGDMDFKVAGTEKGVTSLQMDLKVTSITKDIMHKALNQAREGRLHILEKMTSAITSSRESVKQHAPQMVSIQIRPEQIGDIIGPGGKIIREICETTGAKIDIEESGKVIIAASDQGAIEAAKKRVEELTTRPEVGKIYKGKVAKLADFGAFVNFLGNNSGLVHISELAPNRVEKVQDIVQVGDSVYVKVIGFEQRKIRLSMKTVDQKTGQEIDVANPSPA